MMDCQFYSYKPYKYKTNERHRIAARWKNHILTASGGVIEFRLPERQGKVIGTFPCEDKTLRRLQISVFGFQPFQHFLWVGWQMADAHTGGIVNGIHDSHMR